MSEDIKRINLLAVVFLLFFLVFPVSFGFTFSPFPLVQVADVIEFVNPLFVIWAYFYLFNSPGGLSPTTGETTAFILIATLFAGGIGIHLAGNSIEHLMPTDSESPAFALANFYHKPLSHYVIAIAMIGFSSLLIARDFKRGNNVEHRAAEILFAGALYGFTFFCFMVSGKVAPLGIVYAVALLLFCKTRYMQAHSGPISKFLYFSYGIFLILCLGWMTYWKGLPNFSETGFID